MGLFGLLGVATKGMTMAQTGMDLAGQNISNADVDGYSRKRMNLQADYRMDGTFGQMGFGVNVLNIERMRNTFIDQQIQQKNQEVGYYTQQDATLQSVESIFTEPSDTGVQKYVDQFFDAWQNLANNPTDLSARTMVKTNGEILSDVFHTVGNALQELRSTQNQQIETSVEKVNNLTKEIFNLNREIAAVEINNQHANDSRDKRDQDLKELAKYIDIDTTEDSSGQITVTTSGNIIVAPAFQQNLATVSATRTLPDGTTVNDVGIQFADSRKNYMPQNGQIRALFDCRDTFIPQYQAKLDTLAASIVTTVNTQHRLGYTMNGYSGVDFFDPNGTTATAMNVSASVESDVNNIAAAAGGQIVAFTEPAPVALTFGNPPAALTNKNILANSMRVVAGTTTLVEGTDYSVDYVRGTIQLLHNGYNGTPLTIDYQYSDNGSKGAGDNANAIAIAQLREKATMNPDVLGTNSSTFGEYYSAFIGKLGLAKNESASNLDTRTYLVKQYQTQQDSIAGVSLDDEMADIIKYQHVYAASARVISITGEMLDTLIKM